MLFSRSAGLLALVGALLAGLLACSTQRADRLDTPEVLAYPEPQLGGDRLWAVVPLRNESGTSAVDSLRVADQLGASITEVQGLRALPTNRVIDAMRALEFVVIDDPSQARTLAQALGADGLVLGTITAYDPYDPPTIGISLALFDRSGQDAEGNSLDPKRLSYQPTAYSYFPRTSRQSVPASSVALHLDGRNHGVLERVRRFAAGRHDLEGAYGWRRYLASMDLYERFAAHAAIGDLLESERLRLGYAAAEEEGR